MMFFHFDFVGNEYCRNCFHSKLQDQSAHEHLDKVWEVKCTRLRLVLARIFLVAVRPEIALVLVQGEHAISLARACYLRINHMKTLHTFASHLCSARHRSVTSPRSAHHVLSVMLKVRPP